MYFYPLNFIRFVLAFGVLLFHYGLNYYPFNTPILKTIIEHSSFRVSFFFFISGFVMFLVYARQSHTLLPAEFYKKRFTRIFPSYWLAFVLTLMLLLFNGASPKGLVIILHLLGLQCWNPGYVLDLNYTTWSISVELVFYLLFPFFLKWTLKHSLTKIFMLSLVIWLLQSLQHVFFVELLGGGSKRIQEFIDSFPLWHLPTFLIGMVTGRVILEDKASSHIKRFSALYFTFALSLFFYIVLVPNPILKYIHNGLLSPIFGLFIVALFYDKSFISQFLSFEPLRRLGDLSFSLFIFQYPLWLICHKIFSVEFIKTSVFFAYYFLILIGFSWLVNIYYEKPIMLYLRNKWK